MFSRLNGEESSKSNCEVLPASVVTEFEMNVSPVSPAGAGEAGLWFAWRHLEEFSHSGP